MRDAQDLLEKVLTKMHKFKQKFGHLDGDEHVKHITDELLDLKRKIWWKR